MDFGVKGDAFSLKGDALSLGRSTAVRTPESEGVATSQLLLDDT